MEEKTLVKWLNQFGMSPEWSLERLELPFGLKTSIYSHIRAHIGPETNGLLPEGAELPDEKRAIPKGSMRFVPGGRDGVAGHHFSRQDTELVSELYPAIREVLEDVTGFTGFYDLLLEATPIGIVDPLLTIIRENQDDVVPARLLELSRFLCRFGPDRGPVKIAIALLGLFELNEEDRDLLLTLGQHEEFTLFVAVAIANTQENAEVLLWELAQKVHGWGRIQTVERLAHTEDPRIQSWLLREGYKNDVMVEYLAYTCANAGGLLNEIQGDKIDDELLLGAGSIIDALICGGPAEDMDDYEDGAVVTDFYLEIIKERGPQLDQFGVLQSIGNFLSSDNANWEEREHRGWTKPLREKLTDLVKDLLNHEDWFKIAELGLRSDDNVEFYKADAVARALGIDTWERHYSRLIEGKDSNAWGTLMKTDDIDRIDRVLAIAEKQIDLELVATGPAGELGFGPMFIPHQAVNFIAQGLARFPGRGWKFLRAALHCPVIRNRFSAQRALGEWGKDQWPEDAEQQLERALAAEPEPKLRDRLERLLAGRVLEDCEN